MTAATGRSKRAADRGRDKPSAPPVVPEAIPRELRERPQWVAWRYIWRPDGRGGGKWTKVPINVATGRPAASNDPQTWTTFETALAYHAAHPRATDGVGFAFAEDDPFVGVDLDDCRDPDTGEVAGWAAAIVGQLDSYTEVSPSGTGLKVFLRGTLPDGPRKRGHVEVYDRGRYFTVTGRWLDGTPAEVCDRPDALRLFFVTHFRHPPPPGRNGAARPSAGPASVDDDEIIVRAGRAKNGAKFRALWGGDTSGHDGDDSRADLALCALLAFWTSDPGQIDRLFRRSRLLRPKWDERHAADGRTYGQLTIGKALTEKTDFYRPGRNGRHHGPPPAPPAPGDPPPENFTDLGNARRLVRHSGADLRYCTPWKKWLVWDGRRWRPDDTGAAERRAKATVGEIFSEALERMKELKLSEGVGDDGR